LTDKPLFVYGTLRDLDVLDALLGRALKDQERIDATAPGFAAVHYPDRVYPGLIVNPAGNAPGLLLYGLTAIDLNVLDAFEGNEYRRAAIAVQTRSGPASADVYLPVTPIRADAPPWTLEQWTALHKSSVLAGERSTAAALRERWSARRSQS
jgi:gamma-glutamylcyclotransferase (GGCT)/AIG2-like uncharacterized protein YtfP